MIHALKDIIATFNNKYEKNKIKIKIINISK